MNSENKILVTGASGQLGVELTTRLRQLNGTENVIASDIRENPQVSSSGPFEMLDVLDESQLSAIIEDYRIREVYHLAAMLSAKGEKYIDVAWKLNMDGLLHVLEQARHGPVEKIFWPSSIAVFGPDAPREKTPQNTPLNPATVYGISKVAGEQWCAYYHRRFGVDVRSVRYPGLIGYKSEPGGGTTDYAVDMFRATINGESFICPVDRHTRLPMMYMEDAVKAAADLMEADPGNVHIRTSYNLTSMSFSPLELAEVIAQYTDPPELVFNPDEREEIAAGWPDSIDDSKARNDWNWEPKYDLEMTIGDIFKKTSGAFRSLL